MGMLSATTAQIAYLSLSNNQNTTKAIAIKTHVPMTRSGVMPGFIEEKLSEQQCETAFSLVLRLSGNSTNV
jgi:hypothetical protein